MKEMLGVVHIQSGFELGYDSKLAIANDEINLGKGVHYLIGRNGKGKTTLLKTLSKLVAPFKGQVNIPTNSVYVSEDLNFDEELSGRVILKSLLNKEAFNKAEEFAAELELDLQKPYGKLSTGNKRKILVILSEFQLQGKENALIMVDEPLSGIDYTIKQRIHARWNENSDDFIRIISYHPDDKDLKIESAIIISEGKIQHVSGAELSWDEIQTLAA